MDAFTILISFFVIPLVSSASLKHCPPSYSGQNTNTRNYTLLTCPNDGSLSGFDTISCLSNSSFSTLATTSKSLVSSIIGNHTACRISGVLQVPEGEPQYDPKEFSSTIRLSRRRGPGSSSRGGLGLSSQLIRSGASSRGGSVSSSKGVSGSSSKGSRSSPKGGSPGSSWKPKSGKKHKKIKDTEFSNTDNNGPNAINWKTILIIVVVIFVIACVILCIVWCLIRRRKHKKQTRSTSKDITIVKRDDTSVFDLEQGLKAIT